MKRDNGKSKKAIVNDDIQSDPIRLILEDGEQRGVVALADAKELAADSKLDLVMISPDADPVVCKLMDYGKHVFELKKQKAANRKRQKIVHVKEIKFRPGTEEGDYQVKLRNLIRFLNDGDRAKVSLRFRGRELAHQHIGMELIHRIRKDLEEYGTVDQEAKMEGRQLIMVLAPIKKKK